MILEKKNYLCKGIGIPNSTSVLQDESDKCEVSLRFYMNCLYFKIYNNIQLCLVCFSGR